MEKKTFMTIQRRCVFMYSVEKQALVEVTLLHERIDIRSGAASHEWQVADTDGVIRTGYDPEHPDRIPVCYASADDFEKGNPMGEKLFYKADEESILNWLPKRGSNRSHSDEKGAYIWAFVDGKADKWYLSDHVSTVERNGIDWTADVEVPKAYYDAEEVYKYNDWREIRQDGTEVVHEGVYNRLRLEDDQLEVAAKLQEAINACKEAGIYVYFNTVDYQLTAVNERRVKRIDWSPVLDENGTEVAYHLEDDVVGYTFGGIDDVNTEDGDIKFVIEKPGV